MAQSILEHDEPQVSGSREYGNDCQKNLKAVEIVTVGRDAKPEKEVVKYR